MKTLLAVTALAIAFAAPTAEARSTQHHKTGHVSSSVQAKTAAKKAAKKAHRKSA